MATRAFLLCGDEKAVQAVTQILDELEVSFEHSSEPAFSLKRLATQRFDLLIVDCDNVQNATQVFNSARASNLNKTSIAIAIVEGKAGVPNAFRLGASLVLTKPVALEQVRNTLRTGIGMTRKEAQEAKAPAAAPVPAFPPTSVTSPMPAAVVPTLGLAAPVAPTATVAAPPVNRPAATPAVPAPVAAAQPVPTPVRLAAAPVAETPKPSLPAPPAQAKPVVAASSANPPVVSGQEKKPAATPVKEPKAEPTAASPAVAKAAVAAVGTSSASVKNFDAVFATPSAAEKSEKINSADSKSNSPKLLAEKSEHAESPVLSIVDPLAEEDVLDPVKDHGVPSFGAIGTQPFAGLESQKSSGRKGWLVAAVVLLVLGGGAYGAWLTQPGFRNVVAREYLDIMTKIGAVHPQPQAAAAVKPPTPAPAPTPIAASASAAPDAQAADTGTTAVTNPTAAANPASASSAPPASTTSTQPASTTADATPKTAVQPAKQDTTPNHAGTSPSLVTASATVPPAAAKAPSDLLEVPEDYADDQVVHRVHPNYPKQAHARKLHGTVVLQAVINKQGKVDSLQLVSGDPLLAQAAADAVKQWRYKPYWHNGEAADFQTRVTVEFKQP